MNTTQKRHGRKRVSSATRKPNRSKTTHKKRGSFSNKSTARNSSGKGQSRGNSNRGKRRIPTFDPSRFINTNPVDVVEEVYVPKHTFKDFNLDLRLFNMLTGLKMITPSPIQDQTIAESLKGSDVVGLAETGTGKTAAFLIPLIQKTLHDKNHETLILAPTRELVIQIHDELSKLTKGMKIYATSCVGGVNIKLQISELRRKQNFIIGTPGRMIDLINRKFIRPGNFSAVVLDEADRMLDMGFIPDIKKILSQTPDERQTLFFSATMAKDTEELIHDFLRNPVVVSVKKKDITDSIEQNVIHFKNNAKNETIIKLLKKSEYKKVIVFGGMKHGVEKLSKKLIENSIPAVSIHGNKTHVQRQRALKLFKEGKARVLVATDIAARGIHVDNVTHVINFDLPQTFEDYVHRIGRTGRSTNKGKALTLVQK